MSYKADLQSNNVDLQSILATINALPEAGSGGGGGASIETTTVRFSSLTLMGEFMGGIVMYTVYENGVVETRCVAISDLNFSEELFADIQNVPIGTVFWFTVDNGIMGIDGFGFELVLNDGGGMYGGCKVTEPNDILDDIPIVRIAVTGFD